MPINLSYQKGPTPPAGDNSTKLATTAFLTSAGVRGDLAQSLTVAQQSQARANVGFTRTAVSDAAYAILTTDAMVAVTALTAARTLTLPAAASYPTATALLVVDESGSCSATSTITIARSGSDTINGATSAVIASPYGYLSLESNGGTKWTVLDTAVVFSTSAQAAALAASNVALTPAVIGNAISAYLSALSTTLPASSGQLWNDNGVLSIS